MCTNIYDGSDSDYQFFACASDESNVDWYAWEKLSLLKGRFIYIPLSLMGHRIHKDSETSNVLNNNDRIKEDKEMFDKFWPNFISNLFYIYTVLCTLYKISFML